MLLTRRQRKEVRNVFAKRRMMVFSLVVTLGLLLSLSMAVQARAAHYYGGGWHGGGYYGGWHGYYGGWHGGGYGWYGFGPWWGWGYPYAYPSYGYPYSAYPSAGAQLPVPSEPQQSYWYYCQDPQGYYPYVRNCPGGWTQVVPTPPQSGREGVAP